MLRSAVGKSLLANRLTQPVVADVDAGDLLQVGVQCRDAAYAENIPIGKRAISQGFCYLFVVLGCCLWRPSGRG